MRSLSLPLFHYVTINILTLDVILMMTLGQVFIIGYENFIVPLFDKFAYSFKFIMI